MKRILIIVIAAIIPVIYSCSTPGNINHNSLVQSFKEARNSGNIKVMCKSFTLMIKKRIIKKSMTQKEVFKIIGKGDNFTGIYVPEGISIGYNKRIKVRSDNQYKFFWVHFKGTAKNSDYILYKIENCE